MNFNVPVTPAKRSFYYRNNHGKVVVLSEEIAFEQHSQHPEFLGCSEDLKTAGYDQLEAIGKFFKENVPNPTPPRDMRRLEFREGEYKVKGDSPQQPSQEQMLEWVKNNKETFKQLLKEDGNTQGEKPKVEGVQREDGKTPQGNAS